MDVLLENVGYHKRRLDLSGLVIETILIVGDEIVENFLEFLRSCTCVEGKSRKRGDGLAEETGLKPGESCINLLVSVAVHYEQVRVVFEQVGVGSDASLALDHAVEFPCKSLCVLHCH